MEQDKVISIELSDYNLERISIAIVNRLVADFPLLTIKRYAQKLGMSERTLYRWALKYKLPMSKGAAGRPRSIDSMVKALRDAGYEVVQKANS